MPTVRGMRVRFALIIAMAVVAGCGDDVPPQALVTGGNGGAASAGRGGAGGGRGGANAGAGGAASGTGGSGGSAGTAGGAGRGSGGGSGSAGSGGSSAGSGGGTAGSAGRGGSGGGAGSSAGGAGGFPATPGFSGCSQIGGVMRVVLSKQDTTRGLCFDVWLLLNNQTPPAGLTMPTGWNVSMATVRSCTGNGASTEASQVAGSIEWPQQIGFNLPPRVNMSVALTFPGNDGGAPSTEMLVGQNVDIRMACGLGAAGAGGSGGSAGRGGAGGTIGGGGRGGAAGTGAAAGGSGGVAGAVGAAGVAGAAGRGGSGGASTGAAGGPPTPGFTGCAHSGGVDHISVTKQDTQRGLCFNVIVWRNNQTPSAGQTLPAGWTFAMASVRACAGSDPSTPASQIAGSADWPPQQGFDLPPRVNLDVMLTFAAGTLASEHLLGQNIDVTSACN